MSSATPDNRSRMRFSHRWAEREVTLQTLNPLKLRGRESTPSINKIRGACGKARGDGLEWIWIDSCCIDKSNSQELTTSINSMFQWYRNASFCYTYLADVVSSTRGHGTMSRPSGSASEWFERGWTLQELLAPRKMKFFDANWAFQGTRSDLAAAIENIAGITACYLNGEQDFRTATIATRLSWQARRRTTQVEDMAYSLLGVLGVSLVPIYGEGREAFMRLQRELVNTQSDESLFAWTAPNGTLPGHYDSPSWEPDEWGLLAPSPDCFRDSRDVLRGPRFRNRPSGDIRPISRGVAFPMTAKELQSTTRWIAPLHFIVPFSPVAIDRYRHRRQKVFSISLNCYRMDEKGVQRPIQVHLSRDGKGDHEWRRCLCSELGLDRKMYHGALTTLTNDVTILQPSGVLWPD